MINKFVINEKEINSIPISENNEPLIDLKVQKLAQSEEELFKQTSLLIAPVKFFDGTINIPAHSTGGAVDLEVMNKDGDLVNFGMEIKDWYRDYNAPEKTGTLSLR
ncbi:MAG: hypothetical protein WC627_00820 [Legionella sp.]